MAARLAIAAAAALASGAAGAPSRVNTTCAPSTASLYDLNVTLQGGAQLSLGAWRGNVTLLMNVASF